MHRKALVAALCGASALASACSSDTAERTIQFHVPLSCGAKLPSAYFDVYGLGDFEATAAAPGTARFYANQLGTLDGLPPSSRVIKSAASTLGDPFTFYGLASVPPQGDVHMLLLPMETSCKLTGTLGARSFGMVGAVSDSLALVVGGTVPGGQSVPRSFALDLARGRISPLASGLATPRTLASVTAFGAGALVAGGLDPETGAPLGNAEVYTPGTVTREAGETVGDFKSAPIALAIARGDHAAVRLRSGETLLVGGVGATGLPRTMEVLDPATQRARTAGVALLAEPRRAPTAMVLASGEVFVAGGVDANGAQVTVLEWFRADASSPSRRPRALVATKTRAFVPLFGGGALAVLGRGDGTGSIWRITADGDVELAGSVENLPDAFVLLPSTDDGPLLYGGGVWRKFDAWSSRFLATSLPKEGPDARALVAPLEPLGPVAWVDADGVARGFRASTKSPYDRVPRPLLQNGTGGLVLDRSPSKERYAFSRAQGLALAAGVTAMVADYTFDHFVADYDLSSESASPPLVVLRLASGLEIELGRERCALPRRGHVRIERRGSSLVGASAPCELPLGAADRVAIGFRGDSAGANGFSQGIKALTITR